MTDFSIFLFNFANSFILPSDINMSCFSTGCVQIEDSHNSIYFFKFKILNSLLNLLPLHSFNLTPSLVLKCTGFVVKPQRLANTLVLVGSNSFPVLFTFVTAVSPDLSVSMTIDGQEEGLLQSRGKRDAFQGLVLQHLLQKVKKLVMLSPMWQQIVLGKSGHKEDTLIKRSGCFWRSHVCIPLISPWKVCIWIWQSAQPWSIHSSPDGHDRNISASWGENNYRLFNKNYLWAFCIDRLQQPDTCFSESFVEESVPLFSPSLRDVLYCHESGEKKVKIKQKKKISSPY